MNKCTAVAAVFVACVLVAGTIPAHGFFGGASNLGAPAYTGFSGSMLPGLGCAGITNTVTFDIGWVSHRNGFSYSYEMPSDDGYWESRVHPVRGLWLGGSLATRPWKSVGLEISGGALVTTEKSSNDVDISTGDEYGYDADYQWGFVEGSGFFSIFGIVDAIAGFRWDHFTTQWEYQDDPDVDYYNFKLNYYLPFVGAQTGFQSSSKRVTLRLIGWPSAPGTVKYEYQYPGGPAHELAEREFESGYFVEGEVRFVWTGFMKKADVGAFLRYNAVHARSDQSIDETTFVGDQGQSLALTFHRETWTIGGTVTVPLNFSSLYSSY
ncbi:hypothetical protein ACFL2Q_07630 [Thermodesulfobacteriota bacterium]